MSDTTEETAILLDDGHVGLGPIRTDLVASYLRWICDFETRLGTGMTKILTLEAENEWAAGAAQGDETKAHFTVYDIRDATPVGTCSLHNIDHRRSVADFGILIGERRGDGIGTRATRLALDWAFHMLNLANVQLGVWDWNTRAIRAYRNAGFREVGRRRNAHVTGGRRCDELIMDAIPVDFRDSVILRRLEEMQSQMR